MSPARRGPAVAALVLVLLACRAPEPEPLAAPELEAAVAQIRAGEVEAGLAALEAALARDGLSSTEIAYGRAYAGHARTLLGDPDGALTHYRVGRAANPDDAWLCYATGVALRDLGLTEEAIAAFGAAVERDPRHLKALQFRGDLLLEQGDAAGALIDLARVLVLLDEADDAALQAWGGDGRAMRIWTLNRTALCRGQLGDRAGANRDLEEAARWMEDGAR